MLKYHEGRTLSDFQFKCGGAFALRLQTSVGGGIAQIASEAEVMGDEKSL